MLKKAKIQTDFFFQILKFLKIFEIIGLVIEIFSKSTNNFSA